MKNKNLLRIIFALFLLGSILVPAQSEVFQYQKESFLRNYENDYSKGKTDVSVPFLNVPTNKANLAINVGLSYNNDNVSSHGMIGEVGPGWSLSNGGGVITRFFQVGRSDASTIVYQYSFLGKSGRFYIKYKDSSTGGIEVLESYPSKNKISIQTESDRNYFTSFKIVDEKGYKYIFDKKNISYQYEFPDMQSVPLGHQAAGPSAKRELYTSSFYLTKILDEKDNIIVTYEFDVSTASINNGDKQIVRNRVNKINITNIGTINFGYSKGPWNYQDQDKDNFILNNVVLKNKSNQIINQYYLEYIGNRQLYQVTQKDKNNNEIGKYLFSYMSRNWGFGSYDKYGFFNGALPCGIENEHKYINNINPYTYDDGFLKSITFPTGGRIEYEYEANTLPIDPYQAQSTSRDFSDFEIDKLFEVNYDTQTANIYPFTINNPSNYSQFVIGTTYEFHDQTGDPHPSFNFDYKLFKQNGDSIQKKNYLNQVDGTVCGIKIFNLENTSSSLPLNLRIYGVVYGTGKIYGVRKLSRNYKYSKGGRIKRIKKFENLTPVPSQVLSFDYNLFSDPSKSSGTTYLDSPDYYDSGINPPLMVTADGQDFRSDQEMVIYQNVKVTDSIKNISTRYTYMMPEEVYTLFGNNTDSSFSFDFNGTIKKMGLVKKIEKYDSNNAPVENTVITHTMEYIPFNNLVNNINQPSKILWIKSINTINQVSVNSSNTLQSSEQKFFESGNNLLIKETSTDFTGSVTESNVYYPKDLSNQKLLDANLVGIPLKSEVLQDGKLTSKTETKFDDPATVYPTSQIAYNMQTQIAKTMGTIESYDEMGNIREIKSQDGISTATVWGYYKTQPIAIIIGAKYTDIANLSIVTAAITASNADSDNFANETALIQALDNLRKDAALKNYQITTYTYDPLIGVTTTTLPSGVREINVYDDANRLLKITDSNGKTLKEFKYNYKQ